MKQESHAINQSFYAMFLR